ncbi:hypothetical protein QBC38DRAFT_260731 [Podospora fimiseda]|uniref:Uncharacterized protein n=1 Tax=Podospora fimiseda TaxID=252190 RepID=A0AAN7BWZ7_9PEZI|nr:hypothetical protein QBC38DRAFT_260731 [Podospora fimiseda]
MRSPKLMITAAAWLALSGTSLAFPSLERFLPRQAEDPTTTTTAAAAAAAIDTTPTPTPETHKHEGHEFAMCTNPSEEIKPFCLPKDNETIVPNAIKFITWDPTFFPGVNHTVKLLGFYVTPDSDTEQAFDSGPLDSGWGFYQWDINQKLLRGKKGDKYKTTTVTIRLAAMPKDGSGPAKWFQGPTVTLTKKKKSTNEKKPHGPDDQALYIAMPIIFVAIVLVVGSVLCCNRQHRKVMLGGVKIGGKSRGSARLERAAKKHREQYIRLMDQQESGRSPIVGFRDSEEWEEEPSSSSRKKGKKA